MTTEFASIDLFGSSAVDAFFDERKRRARTVATPFPMWNKACRGPGAGRGLPLGWHVIAAGASNQGKSHIATNLIASSIGMESPEPVGLISLEMDPSMVLGRLYPLLAGTTSWHLEHEAVRPEAEERVRRVVADLRKHPARYVRQNLERLRTLTQVLTQMTRWYEYNAVRVFVVDYLQLCGTDYGEDRVRAATTEIAGAMFDFSRENQCLVVGLSQLNRMASNDLDHSPTMHSLIGGSSLENNADQVLLLDHTRRARDPREPSLTRSYLILDKNRFGPQMIDIPILFDFRTMAMREGLDDELGDWPKRKGRR